MAGGKEPWLVVMVIARAGVTQRDCLKLVLDNERILEQETDEAIEAGNMVLFKSSMVTVAGAQLRAYPQGDDEFSQYPVEEYPQLFMVTIPVLNVGQAKTKFKHLLLESEAPTGDPDQLNNQLSTRINGVLSNSVVNDLVVKIERNYKGKRFDRRTDKKSRRQGRRQDFFNNIRQNRNATSISGVVCFEQQIGQGRTRKAYLGNVKVSLIGEHGQEVTSFVTGANKDANKDWSDEETGRFDLGEVPAGTYTLNAVDELETYLSVGAQLTIEAKQGKDIMIRMKPDPGKRINLQGIVRSENKSENLPNINVNLSGIGALSADAAAGPNFEILDAPLGVFLPMAAWDTAVPPIAKPMIIEAETTGYYLRSAAGLQPIEIMLKTREQARIIGRLSMVSRDGEVMPPYVHVPNVMLNVMVEDKKATLLTSKDNNGNLGITKESKGFIFYGNADFGKQVKIMFEPLNALYAPLGEQGGSEIKADKPLMTFFENEELELVAVLNRIFFSSMYAQPEEGDVTIAFRI